MSRGLKQWQKTVILKNYLSCQNRSKLQRMANCTFYELNKFIDNTDVKDFIIPKEKKVIEKEPLFNDEQLKSFRIALGIDEPDFSIEFINGKQCSVWQSKMN